MPVTICSTIGLEISSAVLQPMYQDLGADKLKVLVYLNSMNNYGNYTKHLLYCYDFNKTIANKINWHQDRNILETEIIPTLWMVIYDFPSFMSN